MMNCDQCGGRMVNVGRMIQPGHPEVWMDGFVCTKRRCPGYATLHHDKTVVRWPALTLVDSGVHSNIRGAMKFRDA
jgi:hypothetical protein